jgi:hypothetical protein
MLSLFELNFIPLFVGAILYGQYLATTIHSVRWLVFDAEGLNVRKKISWKMLSITIILFILMTAAIGINFQLTFGPIPLPDSPFFNGLNIAAVRLFSTRIHRLRLD